MFENSASQDVFNPEEHPHLRYNPLMDESVLVSPHRLKRPWQGKLEDKPQTRDMNGKADSSNPLCPGACRPNGIVNANYESTYVFHNDFPALFENVPTKLSKDADDKTVASDLLQCQVAQGDCRVMCFHPDTNTTLGEMSLQHIRHVVTEWINQYTQLAPKYDWVQIFENKGDIMGCSNPHPHCQIWASCFIPNVARTKDRTQKEYFKKHSKPMLLDYVQLEMKRQERIVVQNEHWVCVVPYWAKWPYETMLIPKAHVKRITDLNEEQQIDLADIMKKLLIKYDNLFQVIFPYSMGWHGAPSGKFLECNEEHWQLHAEYLPPLLRSHSIKKFMVGYEMLACPQRDLTAEKAAQTLRDQPDVHFRAK